MKKNLLNKNSKIMNHLLKAILSLCILFVVNANTYAQVNEGKGYYKFSDHKLLKDEELRIFYYKPAGNVENMRILFVMHGTLRNADVYRDNWVNLADKYKVIIIVPEFTKDLFPGSRNYNFGNLFTKNGEKVEEEHWTFSLIDPIFEDVLQQTGSNEKSYDLFGHSAGSQFAHRFFLSKSNTKTNHIIASNAGSYTMPDLEIKFPYGLKGTQIDNNQLQQVFNKKLVVQLGELDNDKEHRYLNTGKKAMRQGAHRFERGNTFFKAAKKYADKNNYDFNWILRTVPGVGHENAKMAIDAAQFLYEK